VGGPTKLSKDSAKVHRQRNVHSGGFSRASAIPDFHKSPLAFPSSNRESESSAQATGGPFREFGLRHLPSAPANNLRSRSVLPRSLRIIIGGAMIEVFVCVQEITRLAASYSFQGIVDLVHLSNVGIHEYGQTVLALTMPKLVAPSSPIPAKTDSFSL